MKKNRSLIIKTLFALLALIFITIGGLIYLSQQPISLETATSQFEKMFTVKEPKANFTGVQVLVHSDKKPFNFQFASGTASGQPITEEQPFHTASVGKLFTGVLIYQAAENNLIDLNAPLSTYLDASLLENLFVYEGKDYKNEVTTLQLLQHTSGIADYFGGPVKSGKLFTDLMLEDTNRLWTPQELVAFSKNNQTAVGKPGTTYHYSDTGYILLGLLLEKVEGQSFNTLLKTKLFEPLAMTHSYLLFDEKNHIQGNHDMADIWLKGVNLAHTNTLSADWSGGGVISTPSDLLKFSQALHSGKLIKSQYYEAMFQSDHTFNTGIYYGAGGMTIHFEEFFFLLKSLPQIKGHIGILSTHIFYDKDSDTHYILNYGSDAKMEDNFKDLINVMMTLPKVDTLK